MKMSLYSVGNIAHHHGVIHFNYIFPTNAVVHPMKNDNHELLNLLLYNKAKYIFTASVKVSRLIYFLNRIKPIKKKKDILTSYLYQHCI